MNFPSGTGMPKNTTVLHMSSGLWKQVLVMYVRMCEHRRYRFMQVRYIWLLRFCKEQTVRPGMGMRDDDMGMHTG